MSLITTLYLMDRYGLRLNIEQLAQALDSTPAAIHRRISDGTFDVPTYVDGKKRYADVRDVADHLDHLRAAVKAPRAATPA